MTFHGGCKSRGGCAQEMLTRALKKQNKNLHAMVMVVDVAREQTVSSDLLSTFSTVFHWLLQFIMLLLLFLFYFSF